MTAPLLFLFAEPGAPATSSSSEHMITIFLIEVVLMLIIGRLLGEIMQRFGQPAVMGQLIAGILLGPSIFGKVLPGVYETVFPDVPAQKRMIDAISQLGILMLLLLTGIETDLNLVNRMRRTAFFTSLSGILLPFACGFVLGQYLPDSMLPDPAQRLVTSLFLATALSISSVKIVAMVIMEVGFLRRNVGQVILASAIIDDTIGWIVIAVIGGIAAGGTLSLGSAGIAFLGTILFLAFSFTVGRRLIAFVIRWTNDNFTMEMPVITAILVMMIVMSLITHAIGVHTVLGAFVVGILVGQSPILTRHIESEIRGLIVALFAPVFFTVAGREIDLTLLNSLEQLGVAAAFVLIASFGKIIGCYVGGRLGQMGHRASLALAFGMNARGSTEVIVATIGLSLGVLNRDLFTLIVVMAVVTTLITPPVLRWALTRIPPTGEEKERLEREEAQAKEFVPNLERVLVAADASDNGKLASLLGGIFAGARSLTTTVLELHGVRSPEKEKPGAVTVTAAKASTAAAVEAVETESPVSEPPILITEAPDKKIDHAEQVLKELEKGYDLLFLGVQKALAAVKAPANGTDVTRVLQEFEGAAAVAIAKNLRLSDSSAGRLNILLPITGTDYSRRAAEIAVALAKGSSGRLTALHVSPPTHAIDVLRHPNEVRNVGRNIVRQVQELGEREGIKVRPIVRSGNEPESVILKLARRSKHDLVVIGVKERGGDNAFFGRRTSVLLEQTPCSVLVVSS